MTDPTIMCHIQGKAVTIHVCVIMNKCGVTVSPQQLVVTASDWKLPREIVVRSEVDSEIRTIQIHHKIYETYDDVYNSSTTIPSVFVSVLQKEATFLFSFGCGLHGRLGSYDDENANVPTPFASKWLHPVQIACGKAHSAIIDVYSNIYCFGTGANGQLGQGDSNLDSSKMPLRVPTVGTSTILHVTCGSNHTMCMTTEGKVFTWGDNTFGQLGLGFKSTKSRGIPTRVEKLVNVRGIVCGGSHSFIITTDNNVLACGSNIAGQLGLGDRTDRVMFERLPFFRKFYAAQQAETSAGTAASLTYSRDPPGMLVGAAAGGDVELACGQYHSMALCGKRVYSWGNGDDGRLGHGNLETFLEPTLVLSLADTPVKSIACGGSHSGVIAANGDVYLWGNGQYGQLGNGAVRNRRVPTKIRTLQGKHVTQLAFGEWHSMALCEGDVLYSWGFGEEGQLGLPEDELKHSRIVPNPSMVHELSGTGATMHGALS
uniref:RCC1-like domain-containing protein n=1 Tax=Globisporangium ultimum (strain ATCC 200006 / CBS 805.95 / DAOM BR144) TaxID=431595 RepID=K3WWQ6_GLOUD